MEKVCFTKDFITSMLLLKTVSINSSFGVCCLFLYTASGSAIAQNCSYIQNPGFPSAYTGTNAISYTIQKCSTGRTLQYMKMYYVIFKVTSQPILKALVTFLGIVFQMFATFVWILNHSHFLGPQIVLKRTADNALEMRLKLL